MSSYFYTTSGAHYNFILITNNVGDLAPLKNWPGSHDRTQVNFRARLSMFWEKIGILYSYYNL